MCKASAPPQPAPHRIISSPNYSSIEGRFPADPGKSELTGMKVGVAARGSI